MDAELKKQLEAFIASLAGYNEPAKRLAEILLASIKATEPKE